MPSIILKHYVQVYMCKGTANAIFVQSKLKYIPLKTQI